MAVEEPVDVFSEVVRERGRQRAKWGEQNHPGSTWLAILVEEVGEAAQEVLRGANGTDRLREELAQIAAVAIAWLEVLPRRGADDAR